MLVFYIGIFVVVNSIGEIKSKQVYTCGPDYFPCNDGSCVEKRRWCDSNEDCSDGSDEEYCFLRSGLHTNPNKCNLTRFFLCADGLCIPATGRCDGYSSCYDNSDEDNCVLTSALPMPTMPPLTEITGIFSTELNRKDSEIHENYENMMQADHAPLSENETTHYAVTSTAQSNTSDIPTPVTQHVHEVIIQLNNVTNNITTNYLKEDSRIEVTHKQALEFRDVLGGILHTSENISTTSPESVSQNFVPSNETSSSQTKVENKIEAPFNGSNSQSKEFHDIIHIKNILSHIKHENEEDIYKGYVELHSGDFKKAKEKALHWLIHSRDQSNGWGDETARALITLRMNDFSVEKTLYILMSKELHLKLFTLLDRNETAIPLGELALSINALSAACNNPKNFYGHDLVNILRRRTDAAQKSSEFVSPLVYIVLCLNNANTNVDISKVLNMMYGLKINQIDSQALISLAATCISRIPKLSSMQISQVASRNLYRKITSIGLPKNIYELALLTQALNEARVNQNLWNRTEAMRRITHLQEDNGSFGDILSTYFAVPTLSGKSFLSIGKRCPKEDADLVVPETFNDYEKMNVYYSLIFGNPVEMTQNLTVMVQLNTSFMDIMRIAAKMHPAYEFKYDDTEGTPIVYSIGGITNDAEKGLYWVPYTTSSGKELKHFEGDIRLFSPVAGDNIAFWRKQMF